MKKIRRIKITDAYKHMDMSIFKIGDVIDFDCYVQRFNGFVIILTQGTKLDERDVKLLTKTDKHFIVYSTYKTLVETGVIKEKEITTLSCEELKNKYIDSSKDLNVQANIIYNSIIKYLQGYFDNKSEISEDCLDIFLNFSVLAMAKEKTIIKTMLNSMHHDNRHEVHSTNVMVLSVFLGTSLNYPPVQIKMLAKAALLHDLGKGDIESYIFEKASKLNAKEFEHIKQHPYCSYLVAQDIGIKEKAILTAILHHHEYLDGSGYPDSLRGQQISKFTQIITVCDMFDAMTSDRKFRDRKSALDTLKTMKKDYNKKLNTQYIDNLIKLITNAYST